MNGRRDGWKVPLLTASRRTPPLFRLSPQLGLPACPWTSQLLLTPLSQSSGFQVQESWFLQPKSGIQLCIAGRDVILQFQSVSLSCCSSRPRQTETLQRCGGRHLTNLCLRSRKCRRLSAQDAWLLCGMFVSLLLEAELQPIPPQGCCLLIVFAGGGGGGDLKYSPTCSPLLVYPAFHPCPKLTPPRPIGAPFLSEIATGMNRKPLLLCPVSASWAPPFALLSSFSLSLSPLLSLFSSRIGCRDRALKVGVWLSR